MELKKNYKISLISILLIAAFILAIVSSVFFNLHITAMANEKVDAEYYAFVVLQRKISKSGVIETTLSFNYDADKKADSKYSKGIKEDDLSFSSAKQAIKKINDMFVSQNRIKDYDSNVLKTSTEIVLSRYENADEREIRSGAKDTDMPEKNNYTIENKVLYNYYKVSSYYNLETAEGDLRELMDIFLEIKNLDSEAVLYKEIYVYPYSNKRINSNANKIYVDEDGLTVHEFSYSSLDFNKGKKTELIQRSPNPIFWYGISIGISVFVFVLILFVLKLKKKQNYKVL